MPLDYAWTFGDGTFTLVDVPAHLYQQVGTYDVTVTATSLGNCPTTITFDVPGAVTVLPNPEPGFTVAPTVVELLQPQVTVTSTTDAANEVSYWMSDGGGLGSADGQYIFNDGGTFDIVQTVTSPDGCTATATAEVLVNGTIFHAPSAFTPDGDGINDTWHPSRVGRHLLCCGNPQPLGGTGVVHHRPRTTVAGPDTRRRPLRAQRHLRVDGDLPRPTGLSRRQAGHPDHHSLTASVSPQGPRSCRFRGRGWRH